VPRPGLGRSGAERLHSHGRRNRLPGNRHEGVRRYKLNTGYSRSDLEADGPDWRFDAGEARRTRLHNAEWEVLRGSDPVP
jgi:hypothetical protein